MRWTSGLTVISLVLLAPNGIGASARQDRTAIPDSPPGAVQFHDAATDATFVSSLGRDGNVRTTIRVGDFGLDKVLAATGDFTLRLSQGRDVVTIAVNHDDGYQVERDGKRARLDPRSRSSEDRDAIRAILLGSPAIRTFRRLGVALEDRDEGTADHPLITSALLDSAVVHLLDGDMGASKRIGKRVTRYRRSGLKQARMPINGFRDCVLYYEYGVLDAWDLYWQCSSLADSALWYVAIWIETACEFEWLMRSQQYIWQVAGCMTLPLG